MVALKLIGGNKSPNKFYKVTVAGSGAVSVFESRSRFPNSAEVGPVRV